MQRPPTRSDALFRDDALAFNAAAPLGAARIAADLPSGALTLLLVATVGAAITFVVNAQYARKETVQGFLEPERGAIRVVAPRGGVIDAIRVSAGDSVREGAVLINANDLHAMQDGTDADRELLLRYEGERGALAAARDREQARFDAERDALRAQLDALDAQALAVTRSFDIQREQASLADRQLAAMSTLHARSAIASMEWLTHRERQLAVHERLQSSAQLRKRLDAERAALAAQRVRAPIEHADRLADIDRRRSELERAIVEVRAHREFDVRAPIAGRIAALHRQVGDTTSPGEPVLTIVPDDTPLVGRLLVPTSAIGFIGAGRPVRLRLAAFPYQRYGLHEGVVRDVGRSVLFAGDAYGPLRVTQPAYPATVSLTRQTFPADGVERPLQSGMLFDADVVLERRRIVEWLFEPLLGAWKRRA